MSFASMPLYTGDYLRDTRHLTPLRHGIYLLALMHCWDSKGPMPLDEQECAGICNCRSADEIDAMRYILARYFVKMDDGHYQGRMADEVAKFERLSKTFSEAGLRSADVRRAKARAGKRDAIDKKTTEIEGRLKVGSTEVRTKVEGSLVSPSPSPSPSPKKEIPPTPQGEESPAGFADFWSAWPTSPRKVGKKQCEAKWSRHKFGSLVTEICSHIEAMKQSKQWRDGFEPAPLTYLNGERWRDGLPSDAQSQSTAGYI